jgi:hypothetical protein
VRDGAEEKAREKEADQLIPPSRPVDLAAKAPMALIGDHLAVLQDHLAFYLRKISRCLY